MAGNKLETIPDYLMHQRKIHPDLDAFVFAHTGGSRTTVTFGQLYENSVLIAKSFLSLGVKKSDIVAINLRSCPEWLYATFGAIFAGARPISLSFTYTDGSDIIAAMKKLETCSTIVLDPAKDTDTWNIFRKLVDQYDESGHVKSDSMPYLKYLICRQRPSDECKVLTIEDMLSWELPDVTLPIVQPDDIAILLQTSGSTGVPKIIVHTHASVISGITSASDGFPKKESDAMRKMINDRPFSWAGGFPWSVISGQTRVTRDGYSEDPEDLVEFLVNVIKQEKCTTMLALPPLLYSFIERQDLIDSDWPVKIILTGGQPISKALSRCAGTLCHTFMIVYGGTEFIGGSGHPIESPDDFKEYCIGKPHKTTQMKICDENGQNLPANERGEIYVKCEGMFRGYFNDPEKSRAVITDDGWYRTDDIGYVTENGVFFCEGRKSDMIISGGMNVAPSILESTLQNCLGVSSVVCVPVAHDVLFQVVCACVIREDGSDVTEAQLRQYCEEIHNDKPGLFTVLPTYYMFLTEFPETYTGKLSRKLLTAMACKQFTPI